MSLIQRFMSSRTGMSLTNTCKVAEALGCELSVCKIGGNDEKEEDTEESDSEDEEDSQETVEEPPEECTDDSKNLHPKLRTISKEEMERYESKMRGNRGEMYYDSKIYLAYQNLANAIIVSACDDYRELKLTGKVMAKSDRSNRHISISSIESFFRSDYYKALTNVDGEYLIKGLKEEEIV